LSRSFFPPENDTGWIKEHGRIVRRRIKTLAVTPESIGLTGCWQIIALERTTPEAQPTRPQSELAYYVTSRPRERSCPMDLLEIIVGHWGAIENGTHYVRDVTFGEDACRIKERPRVQNMVHLRNFTIGLYQLELQTGKTRKPSLPAWRRAMTTSGALARITR
jgi:hypothetical protein